MQHFLPARPIFGAFMLIFPEVVASFAVATGWGPLSHRGPRRYTLVGFSGAWRKPAQLILGGIHVDFVRSFG